jgi:serine protease Do
MTNQYKKRRASTSLRTVVVLLIVAVPISVLTLHPDWLSRLAYAVEVGQAQASQEQLAVASDLSQAFRHVARAVRPSVVSISSVRQVEREQSNTRRFRSTIPDEFRGFFDDESFDRFFEFEFPLPPDVFERHGLGSGVIVSEDGYILTNNHVVGDADEVTVTLSDKRQFSAEIIGTDKSTDLAVLKINASDLKPAPLGDSEELDVGEWVVAMGSPFGLEQTVTAGIVSATSRANVGITDYEDFIQTDAAINPGNSGGPLVNLKGEVVGINTAIATRNGGYMGVGFAIPSQMARYVLDGIIADGHVTRGWLGAVIQNLNHELAESFGYDSIEGVLIGDVVADGPADRAGLKPGDIVLRFNGQAVQTANELQNAVAATEPETKAELEIFRDGDRTTITVQIAKKGDAEVTLAQNQGSAAGLGMSVQTLTPDNARELGAPDQQQGVVVTSVEPGSVAARLGIRSGDVVISVGDKQVRTAGEFRDTVEEQDLAEGVRMQILREGVRRFVFLRSR